MIARLRGVERCLQVATSAHLECGATAAKALVAKRGDLDGHAHERHERGYRRR